uniref:glutathione S-transferase N-terminal domain-containing protein n=1 Tax=Immundisolibacter sp. TaxID=1934948 RepID=UPI00356712B1
MSVTLDLYGHSWSAPSREVRILCAELALDYRFIEVKQAEAGDYLPEALNPACKVPMIDEGGFILGEAHAILRYLAAGHDTAGAW